jgi:hypothetical protein
MAQVAYRFAARGDSLEKGGTGGRGGPSGTSGDEMESAERADATQQLAREEVERSEERNL